MANKAALRLRAQEEERERDRLADTLRRAKENSITKVSSEQIGMELYQRFAAHALRRPEEFSRSLKTRDEERIRLAYALFMFCDYVVPRHVQSIFAEKPTRSGDLIYPENQAQYTEVRFQRMVTSSAELSKERRDCFFAVGAGKSLFKALFKEKGLSKKEVHTFLNSPHNLDYLETIIYSMARSYTDDVGLALRIAKSKFAQRHAQRDPYGPPIIRDSVRFFCTNPLPINRINDFYDYIMHMTGQNAEYSLKGRTLDSLSKQMTDWHYMLARSKKIGGGTWEGLPLADTVYDREVMPKGGTRTWKIIQIKTGNDLVKEGTAMHHCVASYKFQCMQGRSGIFSVQSKDQYEPTWKRHLTIEVNSDGQIVQSRGFANRMAHDHEREIVRRWASENNLRIGRWI